MKHHVIDILTASRAMSVMSGQWATIAEIENTLEPPNTDVGLLLH